MVSTDAGEGLVYLTEGFHLYLYAVILLLKKYICLRRYSGFLVVTRFRQISYPLLAHFFSGYPLDPILGSSLFQRNASHRDETCLCEE